MTSRAFRVGHFLGHLVALLPRFRLWASIAQVFLVEIPSWLVWRPCCSLYNRVLPSWRCGVSWVIGLFLQMVCRSLWREDWCLSWTFLQWCLFVENIHCFLSLEFLSRDFSPLDYDPCWDVGDLYIQASMMYAWPSFDDDLILMTIFESSIVENWLSLLLPL